MTKTWVNFQVACIPCKSQGQKWEEIQSSNRNVLWLYFDFFYEGPPPLKNPPCLLVSLLIRHTFCHVHYFQNIKQMSPVRSTMSQCKCTVHLSQRHMMYPSPHRASPSHKLASRISRFPRPATPAKSRRSATAEAYIQIQVGNCPQVSCAGRETLLTVHRGTEYLSKSESDEYIHTKGTDRSSSLLFTRL